jgi:hypothetical protein
MEKETYLQVLISFFVILWSKALSRFKQKKVMIVSDCPNILPYNPNESIRNPGFYAGSDF